MACDPPPLSKLILCHGMSGYGSLTGLSCVLGFSVSAAAWAEISRAEDFLLADARRAGAAQGRKVKKGSFSSTHFFNGKNEILPFRIGNFDF